MPNSIEQITNILLIVLIILIFVLVILSVFYLNTKMKSRTKSNKQSKTPKMKNENKETVEASVQDFDKQSVFNFMEFDKIEDNMIITKNGIKYIMVVECQGINYDLMSGVEKNGVEEGFVQFLNTLRHPIQLYIQTRTVNLEGSISNYKNRIKDIEIELQKEQHKYEEMKQSGRYTTAQLQRAFYELTRKRNLYEYGKDVISNTEKMSLNKNVLRKEYYIVIPYYSEEVGNNNFDEIEIQNMAFSELYTRAQSIIRTLFSCNVSGRILDSYGLVDLLYNAYNRDGAETYGIDKAVRAGYDELYSTAPDLMEKKMRELDRQIENKAMEMATTEVQKVRYAKEQEYYNLERSMDQLIKERAKKILEENKRYVGEDVAKEAKENIDKKVNIDKKADKKNVKNTKEMKGGKEDVGQKEKPVRRGRKPKAI